MNVTKGITELYGSRHHRDPDLSEPTSRIPWVDQLSYATAATWIYQEHIPRVQSSLNPQDKALKLLPTIWRTSISQEFGQLHNGQTSWSL